MIQFTRYVKSAKFFRTENHLLYYVLVSYVSFLKSPFSCLLSLSVPFSRPLSHVSCLTSPVSVSYVSVTTSPVPISHLLSHSFCFLSHIFCLTSPVSCLLSIVSSITSHACFTSPVLSLLSYVSCLTSLVCLTSPVSLLSCLCYVSYLSLVSRSEFGPKIK